MWHHLKIILQLHYTKWYACVMCIYCTRKVLCIPIKYIALVCDFTSCFNYNIFYLQQDTLPSITQPPRFQKVNKINSYITVKLIYVAS